jgi:hypothetical protein
MQINSKRAIEREAEWIVSQHPELTVWLSCRRQERSLLSRKFPGRTCDRRNRVLAIVTRSARTKPHFFSTDKSQTSFEHGRGISKSEKVEDGGKS